MLAWAGDMPPELRRMGFNMFGRDIADSVHNALLKWIDSGKIAPILQRTVALNEAAAALTDQEQRLTTGRTVVLLE
jgi:NADPH2:quinone reductase